MLIFDNFFFNLLILIVKVLLLIKVLLFYKVVMRVFCVMIWLCLLINIFKIIIFVLDKKIVLLFFWILFFDKFIVVFC